mmetsp:Transcript_75941/g.219299  ORF Transcript_75941/g.219299 Transcript_75941/m.219299 type:complete len:213 (-) Transcript_75941:32-670(-)
MLASQRRPRRRAGAIVPPHPAGVRLGGRATVAKTHGATVGRRQTRHLAGGPSRHLRQRQRHRARILGRACFALRRHRIKGCRALLLRRLPTAGAAPLRALGLMAECLRDPGPQALVFQQSTDVLLPAPSSLVLQASCDSLQAAPAMGHHLLAEPMPVLGQAQARQRGPRPQKVDEVLDDEDAAIVAVRLLRHIGEDGSEGHHLVLVGHPFHG